MHCRVLLQLLATSFTATTAWTQPGPLCRTAGSPLNWLSRDSAGVQIVESRSPQSQTPPVRLSATPILTIGENARDSRHAFTRVGFATRLSDGSVVVSDAMQNSVRVFDAAGRFVRQLARRGQGPGEVQRVTAMRRLDGDTIMLSDHISERVTYLTPDASVGRIVDGITRAPVTGPPRGGASRPPALQRVQIMGRFRDGSYFGLSSGDAPFGSEVQTQLAHHTTLMHNVDATGKAAAPLGAFRAYSFFVMVFADRSLTDMGQPFGPVGSAYGTHDAVYWTSGERKEVSVMSPRGQLTRIVRSCAPERPVPQAEKSRFRDSVLTARTTRRAEFQQILDAMPFPTILPGYTMIMVDASQRLWARHFGLASEPQNRWDIFGSDGRLLGNVDLPRATTPLEIGRDYLLAKYIDSDGVESIRMYGLSPG
jgi:hypothetical protein